MVIPARNKRELALDCLRVFPGQLKGWYLMYQSNATLFDEMARQGFFWMEPPGRWFQQIKIDDGQPDETTIMVYGDSPEGPFHWSLKIDGKVISSGTENDAITAMDAVEASMIMHSFKQSEEQGDEE